jgi:NAD-dependent dihydropyrimidine dehydrogenase PreA subunit
MALREIIRIDEDLCNGCGNCVTGCHEGALEIIDGKARLVRESFCDGLGACIGTCPTGALVIEKRDADEFDEAAVAVAIAKKPAGTPALPVGGCPGAAARNLGAAPGHGGGCPGSMQRQFHPAVAEMGKQPAGMPALPVPSQLAQWPIQLHLIHPMAPQFQGAHLLVAADCTAFAFGAFHPEFLKGKALVIACPKLDDDQGYLEKLTDLFADARPASVTVARMEVPCCGGLVRLVAAARDRAKSALQIEEVIVGVEGGIVGHRMV